LVVYIIHINDAQSSKYQIMKYTVYIVSLTYVSNLMMAKSNVAETCSWSEYLSYTIQLCYDWYILCI